MSVAIRKRPPGILVGICLPRRTPQRFDEGLRGLNVPEPAGKPHKSVSAKRMLLARTEDREVEGLDPGV